MIGVICRAAQQPFVKEFFELFKTPWEFFTPAGTYDVVIVTDPTAMTPDARLVIVFGACQYPRDFDRVIEMPLDPSGLHIHHGKQRFPVYGPVAQLERPQIPLGTVSAQPGVVIADLIH
jgi:hypothetical protein